MAADLLLPAWAVVKPARGEHVARVVALLERWAAARAVGAAEASRWTRAALLHDALRDAPVETLARYQPPADWPVSLWHGPAAAVAAERDGEADRGVLDAVRYHSVGYAGWDEAGRMLYLADFLEPGRAGDRGERDALAERVPADPGGALREVAARRLALLVGRGKPIGKETRDFWNRLVAAESSSPQW